MTMPQANLPQHLAIIMDGNGRWAKARGKMRTVGHKVGVERTREMVETCARLGIEALTLFAFSSENWSRPEEEVSYLMELFVLALNREVKMLNANQVKLKFIGNIQGFNQKLQAAIAEAESLTEQNTGLKLSIAANYGGRWDIVNAVNQLLQQQPGLKQIDEVMLGSCLASKDLPPLDLLIRTGGETRISNFLIWQAAYAELYFCDTLWPDFDSDALAMALTDYAKRQRRFGMTGEQIVSSGQTEPFESKT